MSIFGKPSVSRAATRVAQPTTIRDFGGGLNVADTELSMSPRFARVLDNMETALDGSRAVRSGTRLLATLPVATRIVNHIYFLGFVICVLEDGTIYRVAANGTSTAMLLHPSMTTPWPSGVTYVSFIVHNSDLLIFNGIDKPLIITGAPTNPLYLKVTYLVDLGTLTNINVPIAKFGASHGQYTVLAGFADRPGVLSISARNTSGTYLNDPAPNDAIELDLGPRVAEGSATITGLVSHGNKLIVGFQNGVLPMTLGVYAGSPEVHKPTDDGFVADYGCVAHRSLQSTGTEAFYADATSINVLRRTALTDVLKPDRASQLIDPLLIETLEPLTLEQMQSAVFSIFDQRNKRYMIFVPTYDLLGVRGATICFSYTYIPAIKRLAWARLKGWDFSSVCRTSLQNIIFARQNKLYFYNFIAESTLDYLDDPQVNNGNGIPITFDWEFPWSDVGQRMAVKVLVAVGIDSEGQGTFALSAYVNRIRYDLLGNDAPAATLEFRGGDVVLYGGEGYGVEPFGTGRATSDERVYKMDAVANLLKFRIHGTTSKSLRIAALSMLYQRGSVGV